MRLLRLLKLDNRTKDRDQIEKAINLASGVFHGDAQRTFFWFVTSNPWLGEASPCDVIERGQVGKLLYFMEASVKGCKPCPI